MDTKNDMTKSKDKLSKRDGTFKERGSKKAAKGASPIHDTSGGEMPDPEKMPSKTKFHMNVKKNL